MYAEIDHYSDHADLAYLESLDKIDFEKPPSLLRKFVELLFYFTVVVTVFPAITPLGDMQYALGSLVLIAGFLSVVLTLTQPGGVTFSVWCAIGIWIAVNISQVIAQGEQPVMGEGIGDFSHWLCFLAMVCFIVQNDAARKRLLLFLCAVLICAIMQGGYERGTVHAESGRLHLTDEGLVGGAFKDANQLAHLSALFAIACLFWSLRSSIIMKPILWSIALYLVWVIFRTVSRGGLFSFGCGALVLVSAIMLSRGVKLWGIVLVSLAILAVFQLGYMLVGNIELLQERMQRRTSRMAIYNLGTVKQLGETFMFGDGPLTKLRSVGITPHNSFLYTHICFGGPAAWLMVVWYFVLAIRGLRMMRFKDVPMDIKLMIVALLGMMLLILLLANIGFSFYSSIYATAVIEKYTSPYSSSRIKKRKFNACQYDTDNGIVDSY